MANKNNEHEEEMQTALALGIPKHKANQHATIRVTVTSI